MTVEEALDQALSLVEPNTIKAALLVQFVAAILPHTIPEEDRVKQVRAEIKKRLVDKTLKLTSTTHIGFPHSEVRYDA